MPVLFLPSLNWDDGIFPATGPAHRLVFGYGIVAWEFQLGMRSWILPGKIAGLMQLSRLIGDGPAYYLPLIATALALLASAPVLCCFLWARRWYGPVPSLAGGIVVAVAPELVYFGGFLIIGCWLLDRRDGDERAGEHRGQLYSPPAPGRPGHAGPHGRSA